MSLMILLQKDKKPHKSSIHSSCASSNLSVEHVRLQEDHHSCTNMELCLKVPTLYCGSKNYIQRYFTGIFKSFSGLTITYSQQ